MAKKVFIRLLHDYDGAGEGEIKIDDDFFNYSSIYQLDILRDCIYELEQIYNQGVKNFYSVSLTREATNKTLTDIRK